MELTDLKNKLIDAFEGSAEELSEILASVKDEASIFPFNEYEHLICCFLSKKGLSFEKYMDIRAEYIRENPNLKVFEISAPRGFGEKFAQTHVNELCEELVKPSKKTDLSYSGEYDFWLDDIKIEVKASRAVDKESHEPLYMKALSSDTQRPFVMNFQQLKPTCCDVFIWVAVFRDIIKIWVLGSKEVSEHPLYSRGQHRGNKGNEGQLHVKHDNVNQLAEFELGHRDLKATIIEAAKHSLQAR